MKYQTRNQLQSVGDVHADMQRPTMTSRERLARWAELLEQTPDRSLGTLPETEFQLASTRDAMRSADTPITVAFQDEVLQADGLKDDTYGEAKRFFELTDWQLHRVVCSCHLGATVRAETAARHVREASGPRPGLFARLWREIMGCAPYF
ncbi:hypothetical protein [Rhizobium giardinii]|uniref:hypothetical protein n=1 Tax=Rhizobium giardinii TaxID=56731 RepID=UPI003D700F7B